MSYNNEDKPIQGYQRPAPLWSDKKRPLFGLPLSFTRYTLYPDCILVRRGFLLRRQDEIRLYRVTDHALRQSLFQRIFGLGSIIIYSSDSSAHKYYIESIRQPYEVAHLISDLAEEERRRVGVGFFESIHP